MSLTNFYTYTGTPETSLFTDTFLKTGSDKAGFHTYDKIYAALFSTKSARAAVSNVLEVGIQNGYSLKAWKELFPKAEILGLDINEDYFFTEPRIRCAYVDQGNNATFEEIKANLGNTKFEFIVDDGCHIEAETINTFHQLLPLLKPQGWFVVEDIHEASEEAWRAVAAELGSSYKTFLINMNDDAASLTRAPAFAGWPDFKDNIVFVVQRLA